MPQIRPAPHPAWPGHRVPDHANSFLTTLAALPADDPTRPDLRDLAIEAWLPLARRLAGRYARRGVPIDDLVQTAAIGLIKAVDNFDAAYGGEFARYAVPTIIGELKRHFRDRTWSIRVPRHLQELRLTIAAANNELTQTLHRSPSVADVAAYLEILDDEVLAGLEGARAHDAISLSTPVGPERGFELGETLGEADPDYAAIEAKLALGPMLATLDERERVILTLHFYGNLPQREIAEQLGISQMQVSRLLRRALLKLRRQFALDMQ